MEVESPSASKEDVEETAHEKPESPDVQAATDAPEKTVSTNEKEIADTSPDADETTATHSDDDDEEKEHEDDQHELDYSGYNKKQLVQVLETQLKENDYSTIGRILKEIKPVFDEIVNAEKETAYKKFIEEGGEADGFQYSPDENDTRFLAAYNELRERRHSYYNSLEQQKEKNLATKLTILEKLRDLIDADETLASIKEIKSIQEQWKSVGPVPPQQVKSLWANYNALVDRYYDKRSIYFELKELDRKKNLELKLEICEKAEKLVEVENIKEAIKTLNDLHEEFKHTGPVPLEEQEALWQRFKTASDNIYARRKDFYEKLKDELLINLKAKEELADKVQTYADFQSEKISDWNAITKEIIELQKAWETIGGLPRESAKAVNKKFWSAFKSFFNHKGAFFKKVEESRSENLKLKEELVAKADALKNSEDFNTTAEELKSLQRQWKEIGPVPEKHRNEVYEKFKAACDHFFNRKRENSGNVEKEFDANLKKKKAICEKIEQMASTGSVDIAATKAMLEEWAGIGFVPKNAIKSIQNRLAEAVDAAIEKSDSSDDEAHKIKFSAMFSKIKYGPNADKMLQKKENALRRQIAKLENDIDLWKNNLSFFAESKTADKLKAEFNIKIEKATAELESLEDQLRTISSI